MEAWHVSFVVDGVVMSYRHFYSPTAREDAEADAVRSNHLRNYLRSLSPLVLATNPFNQRTAQETAHAHPAHCYPLRDGDGNFVPRW